MCLITFDSSIAFSVLNVDPEENTRIKSSSLSHWVRKMQNKFNNFRNGSSKHYS
ncbi:hypothetical protein GYMLUDRAFT_46844 [Collybiopsis luxurians FD-317 M1]|uniref:Uncharacterized protein n=1 Tax=Collybiopsis luxurians FD-317 M1 TaxID=944289 RepID=A0A0D0CFV0_9AGAR|nr:hypothetical protein GYMLUDRAFT_46844 [Collybiopsis luxurians FD-317 M1]